MDTMYSVVGILVNSNYLKKTTYPDHYDLGRIHLPCKTLFYFVYKCVKRTIKICWKISCFPDPIRTLDMKYNLSSKILFKHTKQAAHWNGSINICQTFTKPKNDDFVI